MLYFNLVPFTFFDKWNTRCWAWFHRPPQSPKHSVAKGSLRRWIHLVGLNTRQSPQQLQDSPPSTNVPLCPGQCLQSTSLRQLHCLEGTSAHFWQNQAATRTRSPTVTHCCLDVDTSWMLPPRWHLQCCWSRCNPGHWVTPTGCGVDPVVRAEAWDPFCLLWDLLSLIRVGGSSGTHRAEKEGYQDWE